MVTLLATSPSEPLNEFKGIVLRRLRSYLGPDGVYGDDEGSRVITGTHPARVETFFVPICFLVGYNPVVGRR